VTERLAAVVLAAGRGTRLRPLTDTTPKPLLPVGSTTLLDAALERVGSVVPVAPETVAVNAHWLADQVVAHVAGRAHVSVEEPAALGTAGAIGNLRDWLDGRDVLIANGDVWYDGPVDVAEFVASWDGVVPRLLVVADAVRADFDGLWRFAGLSLLPWSIARTLEPVPSGLYEVVWSRSDIELVETDVMFIDCGTPEELARARRGAQTHQVGPASLG
jgi:MurNAc alpha-1-phosphate uridylyltransferase